MALARKILTVAIPTLILTGCAVNTDPSVKSSSVEVNTEVIVFAAASLTQTFTELASQFEAINPGIKVTVSFAGSSTLAEQIRQGAPIDVFASASQKAMDSIVSEIPSPTVFAKNRVVIAYSRENPKNILTSKDLNEKNLVWIQCDHQVPCGAAADEALAREGVTTQPKSLEPDVNSVLTKLLNGEVDAAIIYITDVVANASLKSLEFADQSSAATSYSIGASSTATPAAKDFLKFVLAQPGQDVLLSAGFDGKTK